jgi:hypothetical protein
VVPLKSEYLYQFKKWAKPEWSEFPPTLVPEPLALAALKIFNEHYKVNVSLDDLASLGGFSYSEFLWVLRGCKEDDWDTVRELYGMKSDPESLKHSTMRLTEKINVPGSKK